MAAGLIAPGYLALNAPSAAPGLAWLGRNSLWIFALHWPLLLMLGTAWIAVGAPWAALSITALALVALPYVIALVTLLPAGHKDARYGTRLPLGAE